MSNKFGIEIEKTYSGGEVIEVLFEHKKQLIELFLADLKRIDDGYEVSIMDDLKEKWVALK
ncbi:hypothetical protein LCGC14_1572940 [marine sediment metagenome]|uniref:Uncharacterized protein n=1 Tax=marine sediment metagenome TaxID=412755 RepID=A0A0F9IJ34_9ZZZZ